MPDQRVVNRVLRSLCANRPEEEEQAFGNFQETNLGELPVEGVGRRYLDTVRQAFENFARPPSTELIRDQAFRLHDIELSLRAEEVAAEPLAWGATYLSLVSRMVEEVGTERLQTLLQESAQILTEGREVPREGLQRGLKDSIDHLVGGAVDLQKGIDLRHRSMANEEATQFLHTEYIERRNQPMLAYGKVTGISAIDEATRGGQPGEMWVIGGFAGGGKTTFSLSWARYLATEGSQNVMIFSLEMSKEQVWRILGCAHAAHPKWGRPALPYDRIKSGALTREEEDFYLNEVLPDLRNPDVGRIEVETPVGKTTMSDIRARAEVLNRSHPLDMILIDYVGLLGPEKGMKVGDSRGQVINMNLVAAKQMALEFNRGQGVLVATPHQINRAGWVKAQEEEGVYQLNALSDANEAERSADNVFAVYVDDALKQKKEAKFTHLKNRDGSLLSPFHVYFPGEYRMMADLSVPGEGGSAQFERILAP